MGATYRFIADPNEASEVMRWFRSQSISPVEIESKRGCMLYFREIGNLVYDSDGFIDSRSSPVVTVFPPRVRRGVLWTVGEIHFLATPLQKLFPQLHRISKSLKKWLETFECVHSRKPDHMNTWSYYLEGNVRNYDPPVYAFQSGLDALRREQYFVADDDTEFRLDTLCKSLRLRGVKCKEKEK